MTLVTMMATDSIPHTYDVSLSQPCQTESALIDAMLRDATLRRTVQTGIGCGIIFNVIPYETNRAYLVGVPELTETYACVAHVFNDSDHVITTLAQITRRLPACHTWSVAQTTAYQLVMSKPIGVSGLGPNYKLLGSTPIAWFRLSLEPKQAKLTQVIRGSNPMLFHSPEGSGVSALTLNSDSLIWVRELTDCTNYLRTGIKESILDTPRMLGITEPVGGTAVYYRKDGPSMYPYSAGFVYRCGDTHWVMGGKVVAIASELTAVMWMDEPRMIDVSMWVHYMRTRHPIYNLDYLMEVFKKHHPESKGQLVHWIVGHKDLSITEALMGNPVQDMMVSRLTLEEEAFWKTACLGMV